MRFYLLFKFVSEPALKLLEPVRSVPTASRCRLELPAGRRVDPQAGRLRYKDASLRLGGYSKFHRRKRRQRRTGIHILIFQNGSSSRSMLQNAAASGVNRIHIPSREELQGTQAGFVPFVTFCSNLSVANQPARKHGTGENWKIGISKVYPSVFLVIVCSNLGGRSGPRRRPPRPGTT